MTRERQMTKGIMASKLLFQALKAGTLLVIVYFLLTNFFRFNSPVLVNWWKDDCMKEAEINLQSNEPLSRDPLCHFVLFGNSSGKITIPERPPADCTSTNQALETTKKGCSEIVERYSFQNNSKSLTAEEIQNPTAFAIVAHKNVHQLIFLLSAIYRPHNAYCIHVDAKSPKAMYSALENIAKCFPNMVLATKREDVFYTGITMLQAHLNCMDDLLQSPIKWNYLINLNGQDFPLKTNLEIIRFLTILNGSNFIAGSDPNDQDIPRTRYVHKPGKKTFIGGSVGNVMVQTTEEKPPPPFGMKVKKNLAYNIFTRRFLHWVMYESEKAKALLAWSRDTYAPEEHYWLTLDRQKEAPGRTTGDIRKRLLLYMVWHKDNYKYKENCKGYYNHFSCVFGWGDVKKMLGKQLFANKFDITFDSLPTMCLRKYLDEKRKKHKHAVDASSSHAISIL